MKFAVAAILAIAVFGMASAASGQSGLYGSPEMIPLPTMGGGIAHPTYTSAPAPAASASMTYSTPSTSPYGTMPVSYGQGSAGPYLSLPQGPPNYLAAASQPPIAPAPAPEPVPPAPPVPSSSSPTSPAAPPASPTVLEQLLRESGGASAPVSAAPGDCGGAEPACGDSMDCEPCLRCPWYLSACGLILTRNHANRVWTTYETGNNPNQLLNTEDADNGWSGGGQITLGRRFCCDRWAVEGTFWALAPSEGFAQELAGVPGGLSSTFSFLDMRYASDPAAPDDSPNLPQYIFDGADAHFIRRINEFYNVELNFLRLSLESSNAVNLDWLVGVRWFHFREHLTIGSCDEGGSWSHWQDTGYLNDMIKNDLVGAQVGFNANWGVGYNLSLFARPRIGIYNNHIQNEFDARARGEQVIPGTNSGVTGTFPASGSKDTVSFLTEIDTGVSWQFDPQWSAFIGYRVFWATGIGLADHQFPQYLVDVPEWETVKDNGYLLLHGAFAGLQYNF